MQEWPYRNDRVVLIPYPSKILPEEFLCSVYYRLKKENLLNRTYPGVLNNSLNDYVSMMHKAQGVVFPCRKNGDGPVEPIGGGWLVEVDFYAHKGSFGFWFFKEAWGKQENIDGSMLMLRYWFDNFRLWNLYATTLATNRLAFQYSKQFGFEYLSRLPEFFGHPGGPHDAELIILKAKTFQPIFEAWSAKTQLPVAP